MANNATKHTYDILGIEHIDEAGMLEALPSVTSEFTLRRWRKAGEGPPAVIICEKIFYPVAEAREWLRENVGYRQCSNSRVERAKKANTAKNEVATKRRTTKKRGA